MTAPTSVVFFDGVCNLCNGTVQFLIDRDKREHLRFAALQSEAAKAMLDGRDLGRARASLDSVLLLEGDTLYARSDAALRIARRLSGAWPALYALILVPRFLRDAVYEFVARHRYRWFGRTEQCRVPTPALRARFLA
jgi:predicted DCC family thiol-disulfide oxidoreductase YuxK